jgi:hypothetical protein
MHAEYIAILSINYSGAGFDTVQTNGRRSLWLYGIRMCLSDEKLAVIKTKTVLDEDNSGALTLAKLEPDRSAPTSEFFNVKYHWFREQLKPKHIDSLKKIRSHLHKRVVIREVS